MDYKSDLQVKRSNPNPNLELQLPLKGKRLELAAPKSVDLGMH